LLKSLQIAHSKKATVSRVNFNTSVESVGIKENDRVLIHAGSGGVGSFNSVCQSKGAIVYTTTSSKNVDWVKALGADRVIDYKTEDYKEIAKI
jgi:NADPH:quinone reductase-like Zn-dependent oxidoreductase